MIAVKCYQDVPIPGWALSYLVNDDASGISEGDREKADYYMSQFYAEAFNCGGQVILDVDVDKGASFTHKPEFGLACDCYSGTITIVKEGQ